MTEDERKANLKRRNNATLALIIAFIAILFCVGMIRMQGL